MREGRAARRGGSPVIDLLVVATVITLLVGLAVLSVRGRAVDAPRPSSRSRPSAPSPSPTPSFPTAEELDLLDRVEIDVSLCERNSGEHPSRSTAAVSCMLEDRYRLELWSVEGRLEPGYERHRLAAGVEPDSGFCQGSGEGEAPIERNGAPVGRYFCHFADGRGRLEWTDADLRVHGRITAEDLVTTDVYRWWRDRFGYLPRTDDGETSLS